MFSRFSLFFGIMLITISCTGPEKLLQNPSADRLYFGKQGGFTNIPVEYVLIDNEHVFRIENEKYTHVARITKSESTQIRDLINELNMATLLLNEPGNMTYYIRTHSDGFEKEIKWNDQTVNKKVWDLYKALLSTVNQ